jgi:hypothetical protein
MYNAAAPERNSLLHFAFVDVPVLLQVDLVASYRDGYVLTHDLFQLLHPVFTLVE